MRQGLPLLQGGKDTGEKQQKKACVKNRKLSRSGKTHEAKKGNGLLLEGSV